MKIRYDSFVFALCICQHLMLPNGINMHVKDDNIIINCQDGC